jgi:hypothetical protein
VQINVEVGHDPILLDYEDAIQQALNAAGVLATGEVLRHLDTDGEPIHVEERKYTSKGKSTKRYETPYGATDVARHVYQHSGGGATRCPLDDRAGIILSATPKFAKTVASKYAEFGSSRVQEDMAANHGRLFSRGYVSNLAEAVASIAECLSEQTVYRLPEFHVRITTLVLALDEIVITAFRPAPAKVMIGSIGFYDEQRQRQYVVLLADILETEHTSNPSGIKPPRFYTRFERELQKASKVIHDAGTIMGISGGYPWITEFLRGKVSVQFVDPETVADLLSECAGVYIRGDQALEYDEWTPRRPNDKEEWIENARCRLLYKPGLDSLIRELQEWLVSESLPAAKEKLRPMIEFLKGHADAGRMNYWDSRASFAFANAGILKESAKVIFGDRIRHPKFKIGLSAAKAILILRELTRTSGRWDQFWMQVARSDTSPNQSQRPR